MDIRQTTAKSLLTPVSGFLRQAGFTHSLTPARNCTYGCTYCYVPTMRIYGGLKLEDWTHWGQFTTIKTNAGDRAGHELRPDQIVYCSPLVDPYQWSEAERPQMPDILRAVIHRPPRVFVIQTRGPLIVRDLDLLLEAARVTTLRISFSVTSDLDEVRRRYEPHCEPNDQRFETIRTLRRAGLEVYATIAPILPCDPEHLVSVALQASSRDIIADPLHVRTSKRRGATTRQPAFAIAQRFGEERWFDPIFQEEVVRRMRAVAESANRRLVTGPAGFGLLAVTLTGEDDAE